MFNIPSLQGNADYLRFHLIPVRMVISEIYMTGNVHRIIDEITNAHGNGRVVALRSGKALQQEEKHFSSMKMEIILEMYGRTL